MDNEYYIVKVDIGSKQKYIFRSNVLKEIIGASEVIKFVTEDLGDQILKYMNENQEQFNKIENGKLYETNNGHRLFTAGGNAMYIFNDYKKAKEFNKIFSKTVMEYFDGLELLMVIKGFNIASENIISLYDKIEDKITLKKGKQKNQFRRIGYGLTELCKSTRKPAIDEWKNIDDKDKEKFYVSKESKDKIDFFYAVNGKHNKRAYEIKIAGGKTSKLCVKQNDIKADVIKYYKGNLKEEFQNKLNSFKFTDELNEICGKSEDGESEDRNYIGITCIDGNGMGQKIQSFNERFKNVKSEDKFESNMKYINEFNELTENIKKSYYEAFAETIKEIIDNYGNYNEYIGYNQFEDKEKVNIIPIRPIIIAGDDVNFISNGKLSIDITKIFIQNITKKKVKFKNDEEKLTVSAGISIVKGKHPFFRAVKIANQLESNSKKKLKSIKSQYKKNSDYDASIIDWHIERGNIMDELSDIRNEKFWNDDTESKLVGRPYIVEITKNSPILLNSESVDYRLTKLQRMLSFNIEYFENIFKIIKNSESKSTMKRFFRAMNLSNEEFRVFALKYDLQSKINSNNNCNLNIYDLKQVVYDAIDIMDLYIPVKGEERNV